MTTTATLFLFSFKPPMGDRFVWNREELLQSDVRYAFLNFSIKSNCYHWLLRWILIVSCHHYLQIWKCCVCSICFECWPILLYATWLNCVFSHEQTDKVVVQIEMYIYLVCTVTYRLRWHGSLSHFGKWSPEGKPQAKWENPPMNIYIHCKAAEEHAPKILKINQ